MLAHAIAAKLSVQPELATQYFYVFARFEYALKEAGYAKKDKYESVSADWKTFAQSIEGKFDGKAAKEVEQATDYLTQKPPMTRTLTFDGSLDWKETRQGREETNTEYLLRLVRVVRNNLFHGGKFSKGPFEDPARDKNLLEACLTVIDYCLKLEREVALRFSY
jgi:hypothetical protein